MVLIIAENYNALDEVTYCSELDYLLGIDFKLENIVYVIQLYFYRQQSFILFS